MDIFGTKQRGHPSLANPHIGLEDVHGDSTAAQALRSNSERAATGQREQLLTVAGRAEKRYPLVFDELYPRGLLTTQITASAAETCAASASR